MMAIVTAQTLCTQNALTAAQTQAGVHRGRRGRLLPRALNERTRGVRRRRRRDVGGDRW